MLRVLILLVIGIAAIWYLAKDAGQQAKIAEEPRETLEMAKQAKAATEDVAAAMAVQSDAIRNEAQAGFSRETADDE